MKTSVVKIRNLIKESYRQSISYDIDGIERGIKAANLNWIEDLEDLESALEILFRDVMDENVIPTMKSHDLEIISKRVTPMLSSGDVSIRAKVGDVVPQTSEPDLHGKFIQSFSQALTERSIHMQYVMSSPPKNFFYYAIKPQSKFVVAVRIFNLDSDALLKQIDVWIASKLSQHLNVASDWRPNDMLPEDEL